MAAKTTILVVEDEKSLLDVIKKKLEIDNFVVFTARTADEAMLCVQNNKIDVIWLDHYLLGKKNGIDLVTSLKSDGKTKDLPIYVVSNTAGPDKVQTYTDLGVTKYYVKADYRLDDIIKDIKTNI